MYNQFHTAFIGGWGHPTEMLVVVFAFFLLFGAKSLPGTLRTLGKWMEQLRQISRDVQRELMEVEEPFREARRSWEKEVKDLTVGSSSRRRAPAEDAEDAVEAGEAGETEQVVPAPEPKPEEPKRED